MENFNKFERLVKKLGAKNILEYMFEIATVIVGTEGLSGQQKQEAYDIAYYEFENYSYMSVRADIFAEAAIEAVLDERYPNSEVDLHELFMEKLSCSLY